MAVMRPCAFCPDLVDADSRYTWHRVIGWERPGAAGGSDITLRERYGEEFAHDHCIRREKSKIPAGQTSMLTDPDQTTLIP